MTDSDRSDSENRHECPDCGQTYVGLKPLNGHNCPEKVPIGVLEDLADAWERQNEQVMEDIDPTASHYTGCTGAACMGRDLCVNDLREVITDYGDTDE